MTPEVALAFAQILPVFFLAFVLEDGRVTRGMRARDRKRQAKLTGFVGLIVVAVISWMLFVANSGGVTGLAGVTTWIAPIAVLATMVWASVLYASTDE